jgi:transposase
MVLEDGLSPLEAAGRVGASRRSIDRWMQAYRADGDTGLAAKPHPGAASRLTDRQREDLRKRLLAGAESQGFATDLWTCPRIRQLVAERYGVEYHVDHIPRLMKSLGFSPQKPRRQASERDEAAIDEWIERDWPRIKKRARDWTPIWYGSTKQVSS